MNNEEKWKGYRRHISNKRTGAGDNKNVKKVPTLMVQKMNPVPVGKLKKYEPEIPRDFIDFSEYSKLTLKNVKEACEKFYNELPGSCDILYDVTGPSCTKDEQLSGMKVFRVRFVKPANSEQLHEPASSETIKLSAFSSSKRVNDTYSNDSIPPVKSKRKRVSSVLVTKNPLLKENNMPVSISIGGILQAGKLITPTLDEEVTLTLESFNIKHKIWLKSEPTKFCMQTKKFAEGGFRNAFKAYTTDNGTTKMWVIKKFKESTWDICGPRYNMTLEEHTRKQVQMHTAAKAITAKCMKKPGFRENWFQYQTIQFALLNGEPITVEPYVEGDFIKYVNNDGVPCKRKSGQETIYDKAEALAHFSYQESDEKLLLVDLQGSGYNLYDPEIATSADLDKDEHNERLFCAGNLNEYAFTCFFDSHKCNLFCRLLGLKEVEMVDESEKS